MVRWMSQTPDDSLREADSGTGHATRPDVPPGAGLRPAGERRTVAAGREFFLALGGDLVALARRFHHHLAPAGGQGPQRVSGRKPLAAGRSGRVLRGLVAGLVLVAALGALTLAGAMILALHDLPAEAPIGGATGPSLVLEAADGGALGRVGPLKMAEVARKDFPDRVVQVVTSIEDRRFYSHWGVDPAGIFRALRRDMAAGTIVEGGSTITQQLVKMRFLGHERTLPHKLREALVALWMDVHLGKDEVIRRYLNSVYLGNGAFGMPAAARLYFDKSLSQLTLSEAAMLAGLIRSPSRDNPVRNLEAAQARAAVVIDTMVDVGVIDANTARIAKAEPATLHLSEQVSPAGAWFAQWVAKEATDVTGAFSGHMRVRTTLVPGLQKIAEQAVADIMARSGAERHASQAALVAMRADGSVVAMVGGRDYQASQFNRAVDARRQPGSAFKLFVYLAALRKGLSPDDTIDASPLDIKGWEPENFGDHQFGRVTLADAFAESINTAAVRLAQQVGLDQVIAAARDLGIDGALPAVPSLALGTADLSLLDLTAAYASVRAGRMPVRPWGIAGFGIEGQPRLQSMGPPMGAQQSLQPYQQPLLTLLQGVVQHGTGRAAALDGFAAGKTGTSQDYRDAWFIGFNDSLTVGVWVGNDDRSPMDKVTGGSLPTAIWKRFMTEAATVAAAKAPPAADAPDSGTPVAQAPADQTHEAPACDYRACARTYQSFRASDCTYQSYGGGRRTCDRSADPQTTAAAAAAPAAAAPAPAAPAPVSQPSADKPDKPGKRQCNVDVCASFYDSFDASNCTYRPYGGGPPRLCEK
jgi:penicillin-binding protein 1A